MLGSFFKKAIRNFNDFTVVKTRALRIPGQDQDKYFVVITAKKDSLGYWSIAGQHNLPRRVQELIKADKIYAEVLLRHVGYIPGPKQDVRVEFNTAYVMMREMEDAWQKYTGAPPSLEPEDHFLKAVRRLPQEMRDELDELYLQKQRELGRIDVTAVFAAHNLPASLPDAPDSDRSGATGTKPLAPGPGL